jgi:large subunit ribosomal protein L2
MTKKFRAITPSQRALVLPSFEEISLGKKKSPKSLLVAKKRTNGRNHHGHITCRHRGGGHKRKYRIVDFKRDKEKIPAKVASIEYDPNRNAFIALLHYADGEKSYILAPQGLKVGQMVQASEEPPFNIGCAMRLKNMPIGSVIHNIELYPSRGGKLVRSAGLSAQLLGRSNGYASIRMPSGEVRLIPEECKATFGIVSNAEHNLRVEGKAGRRRWMGIRPTVRGTAMNPVDHPHGGGEGRSKGNHPQSPWGLCAKGYRTRSKKKSNKSIVKKRSR